MWLSRCADRRKAIRTKKSGNPLPHTDAIQVSPARVERCSVSRMPRFHPCPNGTIHTSPGSAERHPGSHAAPSYRVLTGHLMRGDLGPWRKVRETEMATPTPHEAPLQGAGSSHHQNPRAAPAGAGLPWAGMRCPVGAISIPPTEPQAQSCLTSAEQRSIRRSLEAKAPYRVPFRLALR